MPEEEIMEDKLTTKQDLREMEIRLKSELTVRIGVMLSAAVTDCDADCGFCIKTCLRNAAIRIYSL